MSDLGLAGLDPFLVAAALATALLIAGGLLRVHAGPTVFDRLVAVSLVSVNGVALIAILGFLLERPALFLDIALGFALLVFLLPLTLGRYFDRSEGGAE
jgi:multicomponent Na+:H+ antiporter subunit F